MAGFDGDDFEEMSDDELEAYEDEYGDGGDGEGAGEPVPDPRRRVGRGG